MILDWLLEYIKEPKILDIFISFLLLPFPFPPDGSGHIMGYNLLPFLFSFLFTNKDMLSICPSYAEG